MSEPRHASWQDELTRWQLEAVTADARAFMAAQAAKYPEELRGAVLKQAALTACEVVFRGLEHIDNDMGDIDR